MEHSYDDIISLPRPETPGHPPMPVRDRAAQFAPFAALTGYGDAITEEARLTEEKIELGEEEAAQLNEKLATLQQRAAEKPLVRVLCFQRDAVKEGGAYVPVLGRLKRIGEGKIWLDRRTVLPLEDVLDVTAVEQSV